MAFTSISMTLEEQLKAMSGWGTLKPMNHETTVKNLVLDQETKDLIEGGLLNENLTLTSLAHAELERHAFEAHKAKLLELARKNIEAKKK